MLSDYLFTGVMVGAAMLGVGLLAHGLPPDSDALDDPGRGLMVILASFVEGLGVLAITFGLLALFVDVTGAGSISAAVLVLVPAGVLGTPGALLTRPGERQGVRAPMALMLGFISLLAILALVIALLALLVSDLEATGFDAIALATTSVGAACAIGIGLVGARALRELGGAVVGRPTIDAGGVRSRVMLRVAILEALAIASFVVMMSALFGRE